MYWILIPTILTVIITLLAYRQQKKERYVYLPYQAAGVVYGVFFFGLSLICWLVMLVLKYIYSDTNFR